MIPKKLLTLLFVTLFSITKLFAQEDDPARWDKIRAIKIDYISERLHLTSDQSAKFWPVYQGYQQEIREARQYHIGQYLQQHAGASKDEGRASLDGNVAYQQKEVEIKRKYNDRFLQVISKQQLDQLYIAERDFKKVLLNMRNR